MNRHKPNLNEFEESTPAIRVRDLVRIRGFVRVFRIIDNIRQAFGLDK